MTGDPRLAGLAGLAAILRDSRLDRLRRAAAEHDAADRDRNALAAPAPPEATGPFLLASARERWHAVEARRRSMRLARARAALIEARQAAAREVGRADVLRRLADRPASHPPRRDDP